jgi:3-hydroxybutyrate dehydrogenase
LEVQMQVLTGKTALVTGSTSGIGHAIARRLLEAGAQVVVNGVEPQAEGEAIAAALDASGAQVLYHSADVSDPDQVDAMVDAAEATFGGVDILVNNAGIQHVASIEDFPRERWNRVLGVNLSSAFWATQRVLPGMRARDWGRIVNIASVHALTASVNKSAYVAAKHGLLGLTRATAIETAETGITCNAICPGWVRTPLAERQIEAFAQENGLTLEEAARAMVKVRQPSGGFVDPEDLAELALFVCGKAGAQMTGAALSMDGAWTAQ